MTINNFGGQIISVGADGMKVNGKHVGNSSSAKEFDETKKESAEGIRRIMIDSNVDVKVFASSDTKEVSARLHGSVANVDFSISRCGDKVIIRVKSNGGMLINESVSFMRSCMISNCFINSGGLELDIQIPAKTFEEISLESKSGDIQISANVKANAIAMNSKSGDINVGPKVVADAFTIETASGDVDLSAAFRRLNIDCKSGDIDVQSQVFCDTTLAIVTRSGDIDVVLKDIGRSTVSVATNCGECKNSPKLKGRYAVDGYIKSSSGDVKFH